MNNVANGEATAAESKAPTADEEFAIDELDIVKLELASERAKRTEADFRLASAAKETCFQAFIAKYTDGGRYELVEGINDKARTGKRRLRG